MGGKKTKTTNREVIFIDGMRRETDAYRIYRLHRHTRNFLYSCRAKAITLSWQDSKEGERSNGRVQNPGKRNARTWLISLVAIHQNNICQHANNKQHIVKIFQTQNYLPCHGLQKSMAIICHHKYLLLEVFKWINTQTEKYKALNNLIVSSEQTSLLRKLRRVAFLQRNDSSDLKSYR